MHIDGQASFSVDGSIFIMFTVHYKIAERWNFIPCNGLVKKSDNIIDWAEHDFDVAFVDAVCDKKISDVHVSGAFTAACLPICFQAHCDLIVLMHA